jgi:uncharacterized phage protein gp47/JayE
MPYPRRTLSQIKSDVAADIQAALPGSDPLLRFSNLNILGNALANLGNAQNGYLDWIAKQAVPFTADAEYLYAWGALKGVIPLAAQAANNGAITFTGTNGSIIPSLTPILRGDGVLFTTIADATILGGSAIVGATCSTAGSTGNTGVSSVFTLGVAIAGVISSGTVTTAFTNGADAETDSAFRTRMLARYAAPPQGGAMADYLAWALAAPGVTRAWCTPQGMGLGTVVIYVMLDGVNSAYNGFPQGTNGVAAAESRGAPATGDLLTVANYIYPLRPVQAIVYVVAPVATPTNFTISGLAGQTSVQTAVTLAFADVCTRNQVLGGTLNLNEFEVALAGVPGASAAVLTSPAANITTTAGHLATLGTITWT